MENNFTKFDMGKFGQRCTREGAKDKLRRRKIRLRMLIHKMPDYHWFQYCRRKHWERVQDAQPHDEISNRVAMVPTNLMIKDNEYRRRLAHHNRIDVENARLLTNIRHILAEKRRDLAQVDESRLQPVSNHGKERVLEYFKIAVDNCRMYHRIATVKPMLPTRFELAKAYQKHKSAMEIRGRFPPYQNSRQCAPFEKLCTLRASETPHPIVYLDMELENIAVGRIFIELRADIVPMTAENFRSACTSDRSVSYRCTQVDKIFPGLLWQIGYIGPNTSIFGESFPEENFILKHDQPGMVSMVSFGPNTVNTEFRIAEIPIPPLDGKGVVIGKVVAGMDFLRQINKLCKVTESGTPKTKIIINDGGETTSSEMENLKPPQLYSALEVGAKAAVKAIEANRRHLRDLHRLKHEKAAESDNVSITSSYSGGTSASRTNVHSSSKSGRRTTDADDEDESSSGSSDSEDDDFKATKAIKKGRVKKVTYKKRT